MTVRLRMHVIQGYECRECRWWYAALEGAPIRCQNLLAPTAGARTAAEYGCTMGEERRRHE